PPRGAAPALRRATREPSRGASGPPARQMEHARAVRTLREKARVSLDAALELRRAGAIAQMRKFLPPLEEAVRDAGESADADYLLGRFHRAMLEVDKALEYQERAIARDRRHPF